MIANKIKIYLIHLFFQKISAIKNGIPVCPEKKRSAQKFNLPMIQVLMMKMLSGKGPR
ncbi:MAG: hypothetical protein WCJ39_00585 [bacterium]